MSFTVPSPPATSTLFPYTTLFRSGPPNRPDDVFVAGAAADLPANGFPDLRLRGIGPVVQQPACRHHHARDRKSTRLNSSHSSISYAVFCLKKKNITELIMKKLVYF